MLSNKKQFLLVVLIVLSFNEAFTSKVANWTEVVFPISSTDSLGYVVQGLNGEIWGSVNTSSDLWNYNGGEWFRHQRQYTAQPMGITHNGTLVQLRYYSTTYTYLYYYQGGSMVETYVKDQIISMIFGPNNRTWICNNNGYLRYMETYQGSLNDYYPSTLKVSTCNFAIDKDGLPMAIFENYLQKWDSSKTAWRILQYLEGNNNLYSGHDGQVFMWTSDNKLQKHTGNGKFEEIADLSFSTASRMISIQDGSHFAIGGKLTQETFKNYIITSNFEQTAASASKDSKFFQ